VRKGDREKFYEGGKIERVREAGLGEKRVTWLTYNSFFNLIHSFQSNGYYSFSYSHISLPFS
jgi:hypothetical protein